MKVLIITGEKFEDLELLYPYYRFKEEKLNITLASTSKGKIEGIHGYTIEVDKKINNLNLSNYNFLFLPGGKPPQKLREEEKALEIVRKFNDQNKVIAAICHGPQILISAGVMEGVRATSYPRVRKELQDAGAIFEDKEIVIDNNIITARKPEDLPVFLPALLELVESYS